MTKPLLIISCILGFISTPPSCGAAPSQDSNAQNITLAVGQSVTARGTDIKLTLEDVAEDSRCPTGTTCIWAGDAVVNIAITAGNKAPTKYTLHTNSPTRDAEYDGTKISLVTVLPYPLADKQTRREEYRVTLSIQRK